MIGAVLVRRREHPGTCGAHLAAQCSRAPCWSTSPSTRAAVSESSRPTTHADPTYVVDGIVHYCVANMPGAVPRTSTFALNNATCPFLLALANKGWRQACADDAHLRAGLNVHARKSDLRGSRTQAHARIRRRKMRCWPKRDCSGYWAGPSEGLFGPQANWH